MRPIRIALLLLTLFSLNLVMFIGCNNESPEQNPPPNHVTPPGHTETTPQNAPILGQLPHFSLIDQNEQGFGTISLQGRYWIAGLVTTRDKETTPQLTEQMKKLQQQLQSHPNANEIMLVSISSDPAHDTPSALNDYAKNSKSDQTNWKYLTGEVNQVKNLLQDGFPPPDDKQSSGEQSQQRFLSTQLALVDGQGRVRGYFDSLTAEGLASLTDTLDQLLKEREVVPKEVLDTSWLKTMQTEQMQSAKDSQTYSDFQFHNRIEESGIRFRNYIVDDVGRHYKANHYDHGNGMTIADIDGDGLYDIYFSTQAGSNGLWRNLGKGRFEDVTESAGVSVKDKIGVTASFADIDNDADPDLYVTTVRGGNMLFENDGKGNFSDITKKSGLGHIGHSSGAIFFDYNRDGLLDLFLCNVGVYTTDEKGRDDYFIGLTDGFAGHLKPEERNEPSLLFKNLGSNKFENVTAAMELSDVSWNGDASPVDFNNDGWIDLYVLNMQGHDHYYENQQGKRYIDKSEELLPHTPWGSMGVKAFDLENDGDQDLYITDMHSDMSENIGPELEKLKSNMRWPPTMLQIGQLNPEPGRESIWGNAFYRNQGEQKFEEVSDQIGAENYWPWGLSVGDVNADGYEDVFIASSMCYPFRYGVNSLLLNDRGLKLTESAFTVGIEPRRTGGLAIPWYDIDCAKDKEAAECKDHSGQLEVWSALGTKSSVIFDMDNDGDLDIVTNECNTWPMVLESNLAQTKKHVQYLKVELIGTKSNRDGLGATVTIRADGLTQNKVYDGVTGYLSHGLYPLYFGLDQAKQIDSVEVTWPSGKKQKVQGPYKINSTLEIKEPE